MYLHIVVLFRYLATGTNFSALHFEFLMGVSSISKIIRETCEIIWRQLHPIEMAPPTTEQWLDIAAGYFEKSQFPNCVGAVDASILELNALKKVERFTTIIRISSQ